MPKAGSSSGGSNLVAAGILLSRVAGLLRDVAITTLLGAEAVADAFRFAMRVPNFLQNLLGEGSLSASFVPVYAGLVEKGRKDEANALANGVLSFLALVTSGLVLLLVLLAGPIVSLFSRFEGAKYDLAVDLTRITSFGLGFLVIAAWCLGILNSHRHFFLSYVSPVIWNVAQISGLLLAALAGWSEFDRAVALAVAMVIGSALQLGVQLPKVARLVPTLRPSLAITPSLQEVRSRFFPAVGARGVIQVSSLLDTFLAAQLLIDGGLAVLVLAQTLYLLPISLFGFSVAVSELTEMSRRSESTKAVTERVVPALRRVALPAGFMTAAYLTSSRPIIDALYGWATRLFGSDSFDASKVTVTALVLTAFGIGIPAAISARIVQNTLYALGEVKGPARIAVVRLAVGALVSYVLMLQLDTLSVSGVEILGAENLPNWELFETRSQNGDLPHLGAAGIAFGAAAAAWTEFVLLRILLAKKLGTRIVTGWFWSILLATLVSGLAMFLIGKLSIISPIDIVVITLAGAAVYAGVLWAVGIRSLPNIKASSSDS